MKFKVGDKIYFPKVNPMLILKILEVRDSTYIVSYDKTYFPESMIHSFSHNKLERGGRILPKILQIIL